MSGINILQKQFLTELMYNIWSVGEPQNTTKRLRFNAMEDPKAQISYFFQKEKHFFSSLELAQFQVKSFWPWLVSFTWQYALYVTFMHV